MILDYKNKTIQIKIVYYGCAMSGKTTTLKSLFSMFHKDQELTSIETTTGRTLFFDFGTLQMKGGEWSIMIRLYSATGQDFYASTRPATLMGADGIIFMVDSQREYLKDNIQSWNELVHYYEENLKKIPIMICFNKRDLENVIEKEEFTEYLNLEEYPKIEYFYTVAINGKGVIETFKKLLSYIFPSIVIR